MREEEKNHQPHTNIICICDNAQLLHVKSIISLGLLLQSVALLMLRSVEFEFEFEFELIHLSLCSFHSSCLLSDQMLQQWT